MFQNQELSKKNLLIVSQVRISSLDNIPGKAFHEAKTWATIFNIVVFICFFDEKKSEIKKISDNLIVFAIPFSLSKSPIKTIKTLLLSYIRLIILEIEIIRKYNIHLIREENLILVGIPTFISSFIAKVPYMTWLGGFERYSFEILYGRSLSTKIISSLIKILEYVICRYSKIVFTVSLELFEILKNYNLKNVYLTPNYVDFTIFKERKQYSINKNKISLLYSGRFEKEKGITNLLKAIKYLETSHNNFKLNLVGYGKMEEFIREFIKKNKLDKTIEILGKYPLSELPKFYQNSDIFIIPSFTEGLPAALLEAMCSGCACVCTDVGIISSYILNKHNGLLVKPNSPKLLSNALKFLIDNPKKINDYGKESRKVIVIKSGNYLRIHKILYRYSLFL